MDEHESDIMSEDGVIGLVRDRVASAGSMTRLAEEWGVSIVYISDIVRNRRGPGPAILERLGLEKVITYRKKRREADPGHATTTGAPSRAIGRAAGDRSGQTPGA